MAITCVEFLIFNVYSEPVRNWLKKIIVHKGSKLTPKSVLLPCQIKDLCNSYELITTMNKLGHGVSYSVLQEILTEVAYQKTEHANTDDVILPETVRRELLLFWSKITLID